MIRAKGGVVVSVHPLEKGAERAREAFSGDRRALTIVGRGSHA